MGVKKEYQDIGIGPRLIKNVLEHYSDNPLHVIIETTTEANLKLYRKFGFKVFKQTNDLEYPLFFLKRI